MSFSEETNPPRLKTLGDLLLSVKTSKKIIYFKIFSGLIRLPQYKLHNWV